MMWIETIIGPFFELLFHATIISTEDIVYYFIFH